jgi:hypothetical protein
MGAIAARIESLATDAAAIAAIMATTAPSGRDSMRPWLHSRMCKRATLPRHAQMSAKLKRISMKLSEGDVQANSNGPK